MVLAALPRRTRRYEISIIAVAGPKRLLGRLHPAPATAIPHRCSRRARPFADACALGQAPSLYLEAEPREGVQLPQSSYKYVNPPEAAELHEPLPADLYAPQVGEGGAYRESERRGANWSRGKTALMACTKTLQLVSVLP